MKTKKQLLVLMSCVVMLTSVSCQNAEKNINDVKINAFEKSIEKLENNYKDMSGDQLEKAIENCEKQKENLVQNNDNFTINQKKVIKDLSWRYRKILVKIMLHVKTASIGDDLDQLVDYIEKLIADAIIEI